MRLAKLRIQAFQSRVDRGAAFLVELLAPAGVSGRGERDQQQQFPSLHNGAPVGDANSLRLAIAGSHVGILSNRPELSKLIVRPVDQLSCGSSCVAMTYSVTGRPSIRCS